MDTLCSTNLGWNSRRAVMIPEKEYYENVRNTVSNDFENIKNLITKMFSLFVGEFLLKILIFCAISKFVNQILCFKFSHISGKGFSCSSFLVILILKQFV